MNKQSGFVAMSSVLVVGAVLITIGLGVTLNAINEVQQASGENKKEVAIGFVEACVEDALLRLRRDNSIPLSIILPTGTCNVTINSHIGNAWLFTTTGTIEGHTKSIQVAANRTNMVTITNWSEI